MFTADYSGKETILYVIIASIIILVTYLFLIPSNEELLCNDLRSIKIREINGVVSKVYVDKEEHLNKIVEYVDAESNQIKILVLTSDYSPLFDLLKSGDRIKKRKGSLLVTINRDTSIRIDYGTSCEDN